MSEWVREKEPVCPHSCLSIRLWNSHAEQSDVSIMLCTVHGFGIVRSHHFKTDQECLWLLPNGSKQCNHMLYEKWKGWISLERKIISKRKSKWMKGAVHKQSEIKRTQTNWKEYNRTQKKKIMPDKNNKIVCTHTVRAFANGMDKQLEFVLVQLFSKETKRVSCASSDRMRIKFLGNGCSKAFKNMISNNNGNNISMNGKHTTFILNKSNEWMKDWMNKWMNERTKTTTSAAFCQKTAERANTHAKHIHSNGVKRARARDICCSKDFS